MIPYGRKLLQQRLARAMNGLGLETEPINGEPVFVRGDKFVRIV